MNNNKKNEVVVMVLGNLNCDKELLGKEIENAIRKVFQEKKQEQKQSKKTDKEIIFDCLKKKEEDFDMLLELVVETKFFVENCQHCNCSKKNLFSLIDKTKECLFGAFDTIRQNLSIYIGEEMSKKATNDIILEYIYTQYDKLF